MTRDSKPAGHGRNFLDFATLTPVSCATPRALVTWPWEDRRDTFNSLQVDGADKQQHFHLANHLARTGTRRLISFRKSRCRSFR